MRRLLTALLVVLICAFVRPCTSAEDASTEAAEDTTDAAAGDSANGQGGETTGAAPEKAALEALFVAGTEAYNKDRDRERAMEIMNEVLKADADNIGALYYRAMIHADQDEWDEATADIDRALAIDAGDPHLLYMKGRILEHEGEPAVALELYSKALDRGYQIEPLHARIRLLLDADEYEAALKDCEWLYKHKPDATTLMLRARSYYGLGRYEDALKDCTVVLDPKLDAKDELSARTARNYLVRANVELALNEFDAAYYDMVTASWLSTAWYEPVLALGDFFLLHKRDLHQAIAYYTAAIEKEDFRVPKSADAKDRHEPPSARLHRGEAYTELDPEAFGDLALADFARYIELEPNDPEGYIERAKLSIAQGKTDAAHADVEKALELDPRSEKATALLEQLKAPANAESDDSDEEGEEQ